VQGAPDECDLLHIDQNQPFLETNLIARWSLIGSDRVRTDALILVLTRFLDANRSPLRSKTL
jgi:hypothetical protein